MYLGQATLIGMLNRFILYKLKLKLVSFQNDIQGLYTLSCRLGAISHSCEVRGDPLLASV